MPAHPHRTDRRYLLLCSAMLALSVLACATFRDPGDPAPTRPPSTTTATVTPTSTATLTDTPAPTPSPTPTSIRTVTAVPTVSPSAETTPRQPSATPSSSD